MRTKCISHFHGWTANTGTPLLIAKRQLKYESKFAKKARKHIGIMPTSFRQDNVTKRRQGTWRIAVMFLKIKCDMIYLHHSNCHPCEESVVPWLFRSDSRARSYLGPHFKLDQGKRTLDREWIRFTLIYSVPQAGVGSFCTSAVVLRSWYILIYWHGAELNKKWKFLLLVYIDLSYIEVCLVSFGPPKPQTLFVTILLSLVRVTHWP